MANARSPGTAANMASRTFGSAFIWMIPRRPACPIGARAQRNVRRRLDQSGILGAQLLPDLGLDFRIEARRGLSPFGSGRACRRLVCNYFAVPHLYSLCRFSRATPKRSSRRQGELHTCLACAFCPTPAPSANTAAPKRSTGQIVPQEMKLFPGMRVWFRSTTYRLHCLG